MKHKILIDLVVVIGISLYSLSGQSIKVARLATDTYYNGTEFETWSELHSLAYINEAKIIRKSYKKGEVDIEDGYGQTPLWWAAHECNVNAIKILLELGANVHHIDKQKRGVVHALASGSKNINCQEAIEILLNEKPDINSADIMGNTPLHVVVEEDSIYKASNKIKDQVTAFIINILLKHGASIHIKNNDDETPLKLAQDSAFEVIKKALYFE